MNFHRSTIVLCSLLLLTIPAKTQLYHPSDQRDQNLSIDSLALQTGRGWQLVSVPLLVDDLTSQTVFPTGSSSAFSYDGTYHGTTALAYGRGYWLKFSQNHSFLIGGHPIVADTIPLHTGWNLVGSISASEMASTIETDPPGLLQSDFFGFSAGYYACASIEPGKGYWVKASSEGNLILKSNPQLSGDAVIEGDTSVIYTWDYSGLRDLHFLLQISAGDTLHFLSIDSVDAPNRTKIVRIPLTVGVNYYFRVCVQDNPGLVVSAMQMKQVELSAPSSLAVVALGDTAVQVSWEYSSGFQNGFEIERSSDGISFNSVGHRGASSRAVVLNDVFHADSMYTFRVRATTSLNVSEPSGPAAVHLQFYPPSNLSVFALTPEHVTLFWQDETAFETGFQIDSSSDSINFSPISLTLSNRESITVAGVFNPAQRYYFRVRALSVHNVSQYSVVASDAMARSTMVFVQGGSFLMGSNNLAGFPEESPQHKVRLHSVFIDKFEVTQKRWRDVVLWKKSTGSTTLNPNPSFGSGDSLPVNQVSWDEVQLWLSYLNEKEGNPAKPYRLPTEAEWEFAARGGASETVADLYSGSNEIDEVGWYLASSNGTIHPVGGKASNVLNTFDMTGNVWEWCADRFGPYNAGDQVDPQGPVSGQYRVMRGGSFADDYMYCRVATRFPLRASDYGRGIGFRCVQDN